MVKGLPYLACARLWIRSLVSQNETHNTAEVLSNLQHHLLNVLSGGSLDLLREIFGPSGK